MFNSLIAHKLCLTSLCATLYFFSEKVKPTVAQLFQFRLGEKKNQSVNFVHLPKIAFLPSSPTN